MHFPSIGVLDLDLLERNSMKGSASSFPRGPIFGAVRSPLPFCYQNRKIQVSRSTINSTNEL